MPSYVMPMIIQKRKNYIEMLIPKQVDGLIVFPTCENMELYNELIESKYL